MIGERDEAARRENVEIRAGPRGLRAAGMRADQAAPHRIRPDGRRQNTIDRRYRAIKRKFSKHDIAS